MYAKERLQSLILEELLKFGGFTLTSGKRIRELITGAKRTPVKITSR